MSLFDGFSSLRTQKGTDLSPAESFAEIVVATIAADAMKIASY